MLDENVDETGLQYFMLIAYWLPNFDMVICNGYGIHKSIQFSTNSHERKIANESLLNTLNIVCGYAQIQGASDLTVYFSCPKKFYIFSNDVPLTIDDGFSAKLLIIQDPSREEVTDEFINTVQASLDNVLIPITKDEFDKQFLNK